jgi:hypothetical protein
MWAPKLLPLLIREWRTYFPDKEFRGVAPYEAEVFNPRRKVPLLIRKWQRAFGTVY